MSLINYHAVMHLMSGIPTPRTGNEMKLHVPYNAYRATDGWIFIAVSIDPHWKAFVETPQRTGDRPRRPGPRSRCVAAGRRASSRGQGASPAATASTPPSRPSLRRGSRDEWVTALTAAGIPVAPVNTLDEAVQDPQVRSRGMIVEVEHPEGGSYEATGNPFKLSGAGEERFTPPPTLGQHTAEVLRDVLGYDAERIDATLRGRERGLTALDTPPRALSNPTMLLEQQPGTLNDIRLAVRDVCKKYDGAYWRALDKDGAYPEAFVRELTDLGWLSALIPEQYGGGGMTVTEASVILEEINRSGGDSAACHAQMYIMGVILRHGSPEQQARYLPGIASGDLRLQAFAVTEPDAGSETTRISTTAVRKGNRYVVNGQKTFISRVQQSDLMLLLARTTPYEESDQQDGGSLRVRRGHAGGG